MNILKQYLFKQISLSFFPIFLTLYFITSIVYLVKIAALTSIIKIDFFELMQLYSYTIANILFLTLPISFFAACVIALSKLSSEYELIIITSFGLRPFEILKMLFPLSAFLTLTLLIVSLGLIPKSDYLNKNFIAKKQTQAQFNIKASEYGQSFGDWLIYMGDRKNNIYQDIKLFQTKKGTDQFILAKNATINNNDSNNLNLKLTNGKSLIIKPDEINQINYKSMTIYNHQKDGFNKKFTNSFLYWVDQLGSGDKKALRHFNFYILASFFPLLSLFFVILFSYFNPRYDKNKSSIFIIATSLIYFIASHYLSKNIFYYSLLLVPFVWLLVSYFMYNKKVKALY